MDGPLKALVQLREGLERALGFIRVRKKSGAQMEPKLRAQLVEWEQRLEGLLQESIQAMKEGLSVAPMVVAGLFQRAGGALYGFTEFARTALGGIGHAAIEGAREGLGQGAKLAIEGAKGAGSIAEGLKEMAKDALEGAIGRAKEEATEDAKGALRSSKAAAAAEPNQAPRSPEDAPEGAREASPLGGPGSGASEIPRAVYPGEPVPIGGHVLPPLPYAYNALEPNIDEQTMRIHHDKHHKSYVDGLNKAELALAQARQSGDYSLVKHWERELAFHGAGHYLHSLFWKVMAPNAGGQPSGELARLIDRDFGSFTLFRQQFSNAAVEVEGGGWALLVWAPRARRLQILQAEKHQNLSQQDVIPLLALDVWEHSYYLKYQNRRADYVKNWWNVVNWPMVERRLETAAQVQWPPA